MKNYDTFLILSAGRFTKNDLTLSQMVRSIKKSFLFVRTKIDIDVMNERDDRPGTFNEEELLKKTKKECLENLEELESNDEDVFLISNRKRANWDFARLTQAVLHVLPIRQKECLAMTLDVMTTCSMDILRQKVDILRGTYSRIVYVKSKLSK